MDIARTAPKVQAENILDFIQIEGKCFKKIPNCQDYNAYGECTKCSQGNFVDGSCDAGDDQYECQYPFTKSEKGCWVEGCQKTYERGCKKCLPGYALLPDGSCRNGTIYGCSKYNAKGNCVNCLHEFYDLKDGKCVPNGCQETNNEGKCLKCYSPFEIDNQGRCKINHCLILDKDRCKVCQKSYHLKDNQCVLNKDKPVCKVCGKGFHLCSDNKCAKDEPGCIEYNDHMCIKCQNHLYLTYDYKCAPKKPGCIYEKGICKQCKYPFRYESQKCIIDGCEAMNYEGCDKCYDGLSLKQNICTLPNCLSIRNNKCVKCRQDYILNNYGLCQQADPYCEAYDFQYNCRKCKQGYYLSKRKCQKQQFGCNYVDGRCASCRAPFIYNAETQSCFIDGCTNYFLGGCQKCQKGYDLRFNYCKLPNCLISHKGYCKECDPDYIFKSDGICVNRDEFCHKYNDSGDCVECAPKYYLSYKQKKCLLRQPGCIYNKEDKCFECEKGFEFDGYRCQISGCLRLDHTGCKQCYYPFSLKNTKCVIENCLVAKAKGCKQCAEGYFVAQDGSCRIQDQNCADYSNNQCKKCVKGYRLDEKGICEYADEHCWEFSKKGHCLNCDRLYFLNSENKCQLKDENCRAYCSGYCQECKPYSYAFKGRCYPNSKGCQYQKSIKECLKCQSGYMLKDAKCIPQLTRLSYNSISMDDEFFFGGSKKQVERSQQIFTIGKDNKRNLISSISKGGKVFYSKSLYLNPKCQVDSDGNGWASDEKYSYAGVTINQLETFYAVDIKSLKGNTLKKIAIQYSEDGRIWKKNGEFEVKILSIGAVETIYFTPVYAISMRIVVIDGYPNIKFEFYYNGDRIDEKTASTSETYISETIEKTITDDFSEMKLVEPKNSCQDNELCWVGLQLCEAKKIYGFQLIPAQDNTGTVSEVYLDYSVDGVKFQCYKDCLPKQLISNKLKLQEPVIGSKFRIHFVKWQGQPKFGVRFDYQLYI